MNLTIRTPEGPCFPHVSCLCVETIHTPPLVCWWIVGAEEFLYHHLHNNVIFFWILRQTGSLLCPLWFIYSVFLLVQWVYCRWARTARADTDGHSHNSFIWQAYWLIQPHWHLIMFVCLSTFVEWVIFYVKTDDREAKYWGTSLLLTLQLLKIICLSERFGKYPCFSWSLWGQTAQLRREMCCVLCCGPFSHLSFPWESRNRKVQFAAFCKC